MRREFDDDGGRGHRTGPPAAHLEPDGPRISEHAFERWRSRVSPGCSEAEAETRIWSILANGTSSDTPPPWSSRSHGPAVRYVNDPRDPDLVLVVAHGRVITVLTRTLPDGPRSSSRASSDLAVDDAGEPAMERTREEDR